MADLTQHLIEDKADEIYIRGRVIYAIWLRALQRSGGPPFDRLKIHWRRYLLHAAQRTLKHGIAPELWVRAQLHFCKDRPYMNILSGPAAMQRYKDFRAQMKEMLHNDTTPTEADDALGLIAGSHERCQSILRLLPESCFVDGVRSMEALNNDGLWRLRVELHPFYILLHPAWELDERWKTHKALRGPFQFLKDNPGPLAACKAYMAQLLAGRG